ncbi:MAG: DNA topoisomerase I [Candidatus Altiarchaeota archaeon]
MATLIITEKPKVAERIAKTLGTPDRHTREGVSYYQVGDVFVVPAVGHLFGLKERNLGQWKYPVFDIEWVPNYAMDKDAAYTKAYIENIERLAGKCDKFINSCDYDVEGEVIGFNVIKFACKNNPLDSNVKRMKYSTLTEESIMNAYQNLEPINKGMADAGLTRHVLDWYWGINLSRALSIATRRAGKYVTLSIGRVQGPTLKILATRELSIQAFKSEKYWQIELLLLKDKREFSAIHEKEKFKKKEEAEEVKNKCGKTAVVIKVERKKFNQTPPSPFDLTTLQIEAYKHLNIDPRRTMEIAQDLYINALISYPRTSSQQLPPELNLRGIMEKLSANHEYKELCNSLLQTKLKPNNGKKIDPAHPAIHPTGERATNLEGQHKKLYDLIVRRFMATFGENAVRQTMTVILDNNGEKFVSSGTATVEKGWHIYYGPYAKFDEIELPPLEKGEIVEVKNILMHEKETQPPKRYTPASIIKEMEKRSVGTKSTRSQIVDILYRRNYVTGKTLEVTGLGLNVVKTLDKYCPEVLSDKLTRKFEMEMEEIQNGKRVMDLVVEDGRQTLTKILDEFKEHEVKIGESLGISAVNAIKQRESLGKCLKCEGNLVMRESRYGGFFVGCSSYPECKFIISMPKTRVRRVGNCTQCGYATFAYGDKGWRFCINPECPTKNKTKKTEEPGQE